MKQTLSTTLRWVHRAEEGLLALLLFTTILLSAADILLRAINAGGLVWVPPLVKVMVLWLGLLGALLATRDNQHISIDILSRILGEAGKRYARALTLLFAALVCGIAAWYSIEFVQGSLEFEDIVAIGKRDVAAWLLQVVIPISFALMAVRFLIHSAGYAFISDYSGGQPTQEGEL